jgi:hypothetical protein
MTGRVRKGGGCISGHCAGERDEDGETRHPGLAIECDPAKAPQNDRNSPKQSENGEK